MTKSTIQSTIMGKAYEYACVLALESILKKIRTIEISENTTLLIAKERYETIADNEKNVMLISAMAGMSEIMKMEPRIYDGNDLLIISLQSDDVAKNGDIRDLLIIRSSIGWEIGISVKHNHAALKHSRLSMQIDFGNIWLETKCSKDYFKEIEPIFKKLKEFKEKNLLWKDIENKDKEIYVPILNAFKKELTLLYQRNNEAITEGLVKYLIGSNKKDYYKLIHYKNNTTRIQPFNISGTLNQCADGIQPLIIIPTMTFPTKILDLSFKEESNTTLYLTMNNGWAISFRIHNASSRVEPSLKFDINLLGQPADLFYIDAVW